MNKRNRAVMSTVYGQLGLNVRATTSQEWRNAIALTLMWLQIWERETVARRAEQLMRRYSVHPALQSERFERLGLDVNTMWERRAVWKEIHNILRDTRFK